MWFDWYQQLTPNEHLPIYANSQGQDDRQGQDWTIGARQDMPTALTAYSAWVERG